MEARLQPLRPAEAAELLSQGVADGITIQDRSGRVVYVNEAAARLSGFATPEEFLRAPVEEILGRYELFREDGSRFDPSELPGRRALRGEAAPEEVLRVREVETGLEAWRAVSARPLTDEHGEVLYAVNVFRDITRLKRTEEELAARVAQQEAVAALGLEALTGIPVDELVREATRLVARAMGADLTAVLEVEDAESLRLTAGVGWREGVVGSLVVPSGRRSLAGLALLCRGPVVVEELRAEDRFEVPPVLLEHGVVSSATVLIEGPDGPMGALSAHTRMRRTFAREDIHFLQAVANVLGASVQQREAERELRFQKSLLESQSEASIEGILVVSADGRMASFNRRFVEMWGIPDDVVASRSDRAALQSVQGKLVDPGEFLARVAYLYEHPAEESRDEIRLRDGRTFDRYSTPVRGSDGTPYGRVWFFRDVTDRKRQEDTLRLLAGVTEALTWSLDLRQAMSRLARLVVPAVADWCAISMLGDEGQIERVVVAHADRSRGDLTRELEESFPIDPSARAGVPEVIRSGRTQLHPEEDPESLAADAADPAGLAARVRELGVSSSISVPLSARGRTFGAITLVSATPARRYGRTDVLVAEDLARRAAVVADNVRLYEERDRVARTLQRRLLPPQLPEIPGVDVAALYLPAGRGNEIGGDFHDVFDAGDGRWAVTIGDVCGKGIEAAAVMAVARYGMRAAALAAPSPAAVLRLLNQALLEQVTDDRFCTVSFLRLEPGPGGATASLCCAGHPLPLLVRADGGVERVGAPGTLLGVFPDPDLEDRPLRLGPGDYLVLYTDGVVESRQGDRIFGEAGLVTALESARGADAAGVCRRVQEAVVSFGEEPPRDDMALVVLHLPP